MQPDAQGPDVITPGSMSTTPSLSGSNGISVQEATTQDEQPHIRPDDAIVIPTLTRELDDNPDGSTAAPSGDIEAKASSTRSSLDKRSPPATPVRPTSPVASVGENVAEGSEKASLKASAAEEVQSVKDEDGDRKSVESAAPELKHVPIDLAPDIGDETESGWAAIARSIRDIDEQKIKDYKEDIDTILVFVSCSNVVSPI